MQAALRSQLLEHAARPYRIAGQFNYRWARGKLNGDPIFTALLEQGTLMRSRRVLDLGCGRGLLAAWFLAAEHLAASGSWTATLDVPKGLVFRGVDLHAGACSAGNAALQPLYGSQAQFSYGNMCQAELHGFDTIVVLDALHYIPYAQQDALFDRICGTLPAGGTFITRIGNAGGGWRFRFSRWVDLWVARAQGLHIGDLYCRLPGDWIRALEQRGFEVTSQPMDDGTPFANVLLIAQWRQAASPAGSPVEFPRSDL